MHKLTRSISYLFLICFFAATSFAQEIAKMDSEIEKVTVFRSGAEVTRNAAVNLKSGDNKITFTGLSPYIDPSSIQIKGSADFTIVSVHFEKNYLEKNDEPKKLRFIREMRDEVQHKLNIKNAELNVLQEERSLILTNNDLGGKTKGVDAVDVEDLALYYHNKLKEVEYLIIDKEVERNKLQEQLNDLNEQYKEEYAKVPRSTGEITVTIQPKGTNYMQLQLLYYVGNAGWQPVYDIKAKDNVSDISLIYKAEIYQQTGIDWEDVKINLNTGNPSKNNNAPDISPWVLAYRPEVPQYNYKQQVQQQAYGGSDKYVYQWGNNAITTYNNEGERLDAGTFSVDLFTTSESSGIVTTFEVKVPYSIPSDGKMYHVEINKNSIPATYNYFGAPKVDRDAFLIAKLSDWDQFNLISGMANIYYQNTFVGQSYLNTNNTFDTLEVSLGRDNGIVIDRKKIKDMSSEQTVGSNKKKQLGIQVTVKNSKKTTVKLHLEDQIPISNQEDIEVSIVDISGAKLDEVTGKLEWDVILGPGESTVYKIVYVVKYPKDKVIGNL